MLEGALKTIAVSMANCEFYASIFAEALNRQLTSPGTMAAWEKQLETALPEFYASILVFSIRIKGYFMPSTMGEFHSFPCRSILLQWSLQDGSLTLSNRSL
jgi:hypothetical protein